MIAHLRLALAVGLMFSFFPAWGQQLPLFTQYREYYGYVNPASVSIDFFAHNRSIFNAFGVSHRRQWVKSGFPSITTTVGRGEFFFDLGDNLHILTGGYFMSDQAGATDFNGIMARGAVYIGNPETSFFGLGFTAGAVNHTIETSRLAAYDLDDPLLYVNTSTLIPDLGVGLFGVLNIGSGHSLFGGVSMPQLFGLELDLPTEEGTFSYDRLLHLYSYAGLYLQSYDESFIELSLWGKYVEGLPYHLDLIFRYQFSKPFWVGVGGSTTKNAHLEAGFNITNFSERNNIIKIGYGFDFSFDPGYANFTGPTHEINISFLFDKAN